MNVEADLVRELIRDEGLRLRPYRCSAGKLTIGVGRNLDDVGITEAEARHLLVNDIARTFAECSREPWWPAIADDAVRRRAMLNFAFNVGLPRLKGFKRALAALEIGNFDAAARELLDSRWAKQVGGRARRIAHMIATGADP